MGQGLKYGWPIYNVFDEVVKFDGKLAPGFFYVETCNFFPFRGNGFYDADSWNPAACTDDHRHQSDWDD